MKRSWEGWFTALAVLVLASASWAQDAGQSFAAAAASAPESTSLTAPDSLYREALDLERRHDWPAAIRLYQEALEQWPARVDFRHRLRLCETHFRLHRRYQDRSFRQELLALDRAQALDLYGEVIEKIRMHYVEPVEMSPLLRRGYDNLEVALRDPVFLDTHAPTVAPDRIRWLREALQARRQALAVSQPEGAYAEVRAACDLAASAAAIPAAPVALEFTYGACDSLDDYSSYLTPDRLDELYSVIDGNFVGLGVELKLDDEFGLLLVNVLRGGPAWDAGFKPGERITHVDSQPLKGLDLDTAANRLQGLEGTQVVITLLGRDGTSRTLTLTRRPVEVQSVAESKLIDLDLGIGYIQLIGFQKSSTEELERAIETLTRQGMRTLVLDLRGNPGGLLNVSVEMADHFLSNGVIVSTRGRAAGQSILYRASGRPVWNMPVVVLVDHESASASEILAGALQDNHRAVIVGEQSYGKGSVQSIFPLRSGQAGLKLTTAKFYSPEDRAYSEQGVLPDTQVRMAARPAEEAGLPLPDRGDPDRDPVLRAAIEVARGQLATPSG